MHEGFKIIHYSLTRKPSIKPLRLPLRVLLHQLRRSRSLASSPTRPASPSRAYSLYLVSYQTIATSSSLSTRYLFQKRLVGARSSLCCHLCSSSLLLHRLPIRFFTLVAELPSSCLGKSLYSLYTNQFYSLFGFFDFHHGSADRCQPGDVWSHSTQLGTGE